MKSELQNTAGLLEAIQDGRFWIKRFTRKEYSKAFEAYMNQFGPRYQEALRNPDVLPDVAEEMLDGIAEGWKRQRPWNRTVAAMDDKQMMITYLSPMLLKLEGGERLAELLRDGWAARWPKDAYENGSYEELLGGFRNTIMGLEIFCHKD